MEFVFEAKFNPYVWESMWFTISIHKTRNGAVNAIRRFKYSQKKEYFKDIEEESWKNNETYKEYVEDYRYGVTRTELNE